MVTFKRSFMSQEQNFDLNAWWNEQSFDAKELFSLDENGNLTLREANNVKERVVATITAENAGIVIHNLQEKFTQVEARVHETELEWVAAEDKLKMADKVAHLREYLNTVSAIGDFVKPGVLVHTWEHALHALIEENYQARLMVVEQAEALAQSEDWKETTKILKDITEQWKHLGYIDRNRNDKLWARIEAARHTFYERKREHHSEEEKDLLHNLDLKLDLVEQAEVMAASTDWKTTSEAFHRLTEEWKKIGPTLNKKNEELWQRFMAAKSAFFEKKREHSARIQVEQEQNYVVKLALVEKAEALRESTEWNATAQAYAALMEEWKKTGRVGAERGDELWKRFTDAQELFFSAKRKHADELKNMHESNYKLKAELLERAERIKNSSRWADTTLEMNELLDAWKKIGPIARSHGNKLWDDFIAARKHFFGRKDANREQRKQQAEFLKSARDEAARNMIIKLQNEIAHEEEKLLDFQNALDNVTPGKKADELRTHLDTLIADANAKLKRLREKFAAVTDEMRIKDEKAQAEKEAAEKEEQ